MIVGMQCVNTELCLQPKQQSRSAARLTYCWFINGSQVHLASAQRSAEFFIPRGQFSGRSARDFSEFVTAFFMCFFFFGVKAPVSTNANT